MFIAAFFTRTKRWKQLKCPCMDEVMNKVWFLHAMEILFSLNKEGRPVACMNLEDILLSGIS